MFNSLKYNKILTIVITISILILISVGVFWGYDVYKRHKIKQETGDAVNEFDENVTRTSIKGSGEGNLVENTNLDFDENLVSASN